MEDAKQTVSAVLNSVAIVIDNPEPEEAVETEEED